MNCPHCGAAGISGETRFDCGTNRIPGALGTITCYTRQISQLKAELSQCVRRDDPRLREALDWFNSRNFASNIAANIYDSISGK